MADNTAKARKDLDGQRRSIREHIEKWKTYPAAQDKEFALKTIRRCQDHVSKLRRDHPSLGSSWEDSWRP